MARYLSFCIWMFASFLAPSAAASTLASAALEAALLMPPVPSKTGEDLASQAALHSAGRRLTAFEQTVSTSSRATCCAQSSLLMQLTTRIRSKKR